MAKALKGVRVIDLTVWFQGPVCSQHLADFGAEVIKVERPVHGDQGRGVRSIKALPVGDWNQYFLVINRNKTQVMCNAYANAGDKWIVQPMFISPKACKTTPYACDTATDAAGQAIRDELGAVFPQALTDDVCTL